ncbi:MAG TPA: DUF885 domain-containing protein [Bacteroidia bacterium]|nr:DUF885 domain-containing protein [Bacteroidia bacterium]
MKKIILLIPFALLLIFFNRCQPGKEKKAEVIVSGNNISEFFQRYYDERMQLFPLEATANGENRYNDMLPIDISESYRQKIKSFYESFLHELNGYDRNALAENDQVSYDILKWDLQTGIEGFGFPDNLLPVNQFWSLPLTFGQLGSGQSNQPFKTVKDYENFLGRVNSFPGWCDTAIANMQKGIAAGITNPGILMERVLPQMKAMVTDDIKENVFYMPVKNFPGSFSNSDKKRLDSLYSKAIVSQIIPSYKKLYDFFKDEYIPHCRTSVGISAVPGGTEHYNYLIKYWTTTTLTPDSIFNLGMSEVKRLRGEMEKIKTETGYKGDLKSFFKYMNTDKKFFPFSAPKEVLDSFNGIYNIMKPQVGRLFDKVPKSRFEIRQTEKFREASASAEYNAGTADGSRPGIFYVPVPDAKKFNTYAMEDLFLHEAIPGHHFQNMLTAENDSLPMFRRFIWYGAYGEGWALYTESLGKELGLYTDPYQYFAALSEEMHRAIRLVVDVGMHTKGWTREQAIQFSLDNEGESEEAIIPEIERYMAIPAQALCYKIGQLKIRDLRKNAESVLGHDFDIRKFHNEILNDGCLPLFVLEGKMNRWMEKEKENKKAD